MKVRGFVHAVVCSLMLWPAVPASAQQPAGQRDKELDEMVSNELLWEEATASVLVIANMPDTAAAPLDELKAAQARLERAVVRLINSRPPASQLQTHLVLLPAVQEVTAAARAVVDARTAADEAALASSQAWLDDSLSQLAVALRQLRQAGIQN